jgi:hypothetical protein
MFNGRNSDTRGIAQGAAKLCAADIIIAGLYAYVRIVKPTGSAQVHAPESNAATGFGRINGKTHLLTRMETNACASNAVT